MKTSRLITWLMIASLSISAAGIALASPTSVPSWVTSTANPNGIFSDYFKHLADNPCTGSSIVTGFNTWSTTYLIPTCNSTQSILHKLFFDSLLTNSDIVFNYDGTPKNLVIPSSQWWIVSGGIAYTWGNVGISGNMQSTGSVVIRNTAPTIYLRDTDNRSAMIHNSANHLYFLRGDWNDSTTWAPYNGMWPLDIDLENNNAAFWGNLYVNSGSIYANANINQNLNIWSVGRDYIPASWNWNYTALLNGKDTTSIWFHDSMLSVSSIRYNNSGFVIGGDDGWGVKDVTMSGNVVVWKELNVSGNVTANWFIYNSDRRLKDNIVPLSSSLEKILSLNGYSFSWKSTGAKDIGVIAQEVEAVYPELVHTNSTGFKSVEYGNLIAPLIEAVKTQQKEIESLKAEVEALKNTK